MLFRKTCNLKYLLRAIFMIITQGRSVEVIWSVFCIFAYPPSKVIRSQECDKVISKVVGELSKGLVEYISREEILKMYGNDYFVNDIPIDFARVRAESVAIIGKFLVLGEYAEDSARLLFLTDKSCHVNYHYNNVKGVRHIHSIHNENFKGTFLVSTGDGKKVLDRWELYENGAFHRVRLKRYFAGYTAACKVKNIIFFGTDFSSRPNYLDTLKGEKYPFPRPAYKMFVVISKPIDERYLYCVSKELRVLGEKKCLSVFDVELRSFIYCNYLNSANKLSQQDAASRAAA